MSDLHVVCKVCGTPRERHCRACAEDIPASNDPRWPKWAEHLIAHPELRPFQGVRAIGGWTGIRCTNVDLWIENDNAPLTPIDEIASRRLFMPMD